MTALTIRKDRTPAVLRKLAKAESNARVARRLLAIANALSGMSRKESAEAAGMDRQTLRDWVIRYNADGPAGLCDVWGEGRPPRPSEARRPRSARIFSADQTLGSPGDPSTTPLIAAVDEGISAGELKSGRDSPGRGNAERLPKRA